MQQLVGRPTLYNLFDCQDLAMQQPVGRPTLYNLFDCQDMAMQQPVGRPALYNLFDCQDLAMQQVVERSGPAMNKATSVEQHHTLEVAVFLIDRAEENLGRIVERYAVGH